MQVKYLAKYLDELFEGNISGIANHGLFVELKDNGCEGLVEIKPTYKRNILASCFWNKVVDVCKHPAP